LKYRRRVERKRHNTSVISGDGTKECRSPKAVCNGLVDDVDKIRLKYDAVIRTCFLAHLVEETALKEAFLEHDHRQSIQLARLYRRPTCKSMFVMNAKDGLVAPDFDAPPSRWNAPVLKNAEIDRTTVEHGSDFISTSFHRRDDDRWIGSMKRGDQLRKAYLSEHRRHANFDFADSKIRSEPQFLSRKLELLKNPLRATDQEPCLR